ncbi:uncharacterized protein LOC100215907 isoform X1 [Hydra vulgaris]|uniref:uncharacterized protein LOC100215907 isoform X1 n=1 Tax=Hydra vulgaris TaxID=6087 RepID=UPI001F5F88C6|nr:uncharacterized protein LOC100215907 [Hydra vulgaris]
MMNNLLLLLVVINATCFVEARKRHYYYDSKSKPSPQYIDKIYSFESNNYPQHRIGVRSDATAAIILYGIEEFRIVKALNGRVDSISIQSLLDSNKYLRHQNFILKLHSVENSELFKNDASFIIHNDKYYSNYISLESTNYPGYFVRHQDYTLKLHKEEPLSELYKRDASFRLVQLGITLIGKQFSFQSINYPQYQIGIKSDGTAAIVLNSLDGFRIVKALNGRADSVSFQSIKDGKKYLRHQNFVLKLHEVDLISELFKNDASFIIRNNYYFPDYVSFESTNYPGYFLRHQDYTIKLHKEEPNVELYQKDASFKPLQIELSSITTRIEEVTSVEVEKKLSFIGQAFSLESINYPQYRIGVRDDSSAAILLFGVEEFRIVKALNGREDAVSLQSVVESNKYLRHQNFILKLHSIDNSELFKNDVSFIIRNDKYYTGYISFESTNYPGYFLRHQDYTVKLHKEEPSVELYRKDASFKLVQLGVSLIGKQFSFQSINYPQYQIGIKSDDTAAIVLNSQDGFRVVKALNGRADSVSFQSIKDEKKYLRHQNFILKLHPVDLSSELFKNDASFIVRKGYYFPGFVSFESTNYPGYFLRHQDYTIKLHKEEPLVELFRKDASFMPLQLEISSITTRIEEVTSVEVEKKLSFIGQAFSLESINYPQYRIGVRDDSSAAILLFGVEEFRIVKALNGREDAVSLQSVVESNKYLRHQNFILKLHSIDNSELFKNDASFIIRNDKYYTGYISFESTNYPGYFLRHQDYTVKLHKEEPSVELYRKDASFKLVQLGVSLIGKQFSFQSINYPQYQIGIKSDDTAAIVLNSQDGFRVVKALNGRADSVSFQSIKDEKRYLRHQNFILKLHPVDLSSELFKNDASFIVRKGYYFPGFVSFESTNYPGYFLRHQDYTIKLHKEEPLVELFRKDASFMPLQLEISSITTRIEEVTSVEVEKKLSFIGQAFSLESINYPQYRIGVRDDSSAAILLFGVEEFRIVKALNGREDAVSLQSVVESNKYLRHQNFILKLHSIDNSELFKNDASFIIRNDKYYTGYISFESTNYPGYFLRHQDYTVKLHKEEPSVELYRKDASFKLVQLGVSLIGKQFSFQSINYPQYQIGIKSDDTAAIVLNSQDGFRVVKALNGRADSVSFQSIKDEKKYLRHQNFILKLHPVDLSSELFKNDASFIVRKGYYFPGFVSFESTNYPGYFLRHQDYTIKLHKEEPLVELFRKDASFMPLQLEISSITTRIEEVTSVEVEKKLSFIGQAFSLESINYPQYRIGVRDDSSAAILLFGVEEFRIVKALNGREDAVSLQSVVESNKYLRHQNFILKLHSIDNSELFKNDASFIIRNDKYYTGYISFESTNYPGYFLRHQDYTVKLHKEEPSVELYRKDASFKLVQLGVSLIGKQFSFQSINYPQYQIGIKSDDTAAIVLNSQDGFRVVKALNGRADSVSFQSIKDEKKYLRHQNFILKLHPVDLSSELFKNDASFIVRKGYYFPGFVSFESTNYPGYFLRHQDYTIKLHKEEPLVELFRKDASFMPLQLEISSITTRIEEVTSVEVEKKLSFISQAFSLESINYPQYRIGVRDDSSAAILLFGVEEFRIVKALNGREDAVSLQSVVESNKYLRHQNFILKLHSIDNSELFKNDASFIIRNDKYYTGYISFESTNYPGYFLRHQDYTVKLHKEEPSVELYRKDASFKLVQLGVSLIGKQFSFQSINYPQYQIGIKSDDTAAIVLNSQDGFRVVKALNGRADSVSFQSIKDEKKYLRHQNFILKLHPVDLSSELFKNDASFIVRKGYYFPGFVSFESTNYPGYFLRHQDYTIKLHKEEPLVELFRKDASFMPLQLEISSITTRIEEVTSVEVEKKLSFIGQAFSLESINYPQYRIGVRDDSSAAILLFGVEEFRIVKALNGREDAVSLQSVVESNKYLRHQNFILKLHSIDNSELFKNDASFIIRNDKYYTGYISFESTNYPGYFLRHQDYTVKLHKEEPSVELYRKDASFKLVQLGVSLIGKQFSFQSINYPQYQIGIKSDDTAAIVLNSQDGFRVVKALNGRADSVSFQSIKDEKKYLRHQNFILKLHPVDLSSELFKNDASFIVRKGYYFPGFVSFESTNYPGYFLRHQDYTIKLHKEEPLVELFRKDASFMPLQLEISSITTRIEEVTSVEVEKKLSFIGQAFSLESINYPQYRIGVRDDSSAAILLFGVEEFRIVKALNGREDAVSLQSVVESNKYLRHQNFILKLHSIDNSELFKNDASFIIRNDKYYTGYISFESTNYPGYFLRHQDYTVKLHKEEPSVELYRKDASFKLVQLGVSLIGKQFSFQSINYPQYQIGIKSDDTAAIVLNSQDGFRVVKALNGRADSVSFQSIKDEKKYLRHQNFILKLHPVDLSSELFKNDASFIVRKGYYFPGFVSFESTNYPGYFLRHQDYTIKLHKEEPLVELFRKDASFMPLQLEISQISIDSFESSSYPQQLGGVYSLESNNYPQHRIGVRNDETAAIILYGIEEFRIVKALNGRLDSISLQSSKERNKYLRHQNFILKLHPVELSSELFKNDASFVIRENKYYPGYVSFESTNYPGYFLRHQDFTVKLHKEEPNVELYRRDASFKLTQLGVLRIGDEYIFQSNNYPKYRIGIKDDDTAAILTNSLDEFRVVKALNGRGDSVSLQAIKESTKYLRHRNFILKLDVLDLDSELFKNDASFIIRDNYYYPGFVSIESTNYPGYFLRHQDYTIKLHKEEPFVELYRRDASFKLVQSDLCN